MYCIDRVNEAREYSDGRNEPRTYLTHLYARYKTLFKSENEPFYFSLNTNTTVDSSKKHTSKTVKIKYISFHFLILTPLTHFFMLMEIPDITKSKIFTHTELLDYDIAVKKTNSIITNQEKYLSLIKSGQFNDDTKLYLLFNKFLKKTKIINLNGFHYSLYLYQKADNGRNIKIIFQLVEVFTYRNNPENNHEDINNSYFKKDPLIKLFLKYYPELRQKIEHLINGVDLTVYSRGILKCHFVEVADCIIDSDLFLKPKRNVIQRKTKTQIKKNKQNKKQERQNKQNDTTPEDTTPIEQIDTDNSDTDNSDTEKDNSDIEAVISDTESDNSDGIGKDEFKKSQYPFNLSFNYNTRFNSKNRIIELIYNLYDGNKSFQNLMMVYNCICIIKDIHNDSITDDKTLHITIFLKNIHTNERSETLHGYIKNDCIISLTRIHNLI